MKLAFKRLGMKRVKRCGIPIVLRTTRRYYLANFHLEFGTFLRHASVNENRDAERGEHFFRSDNDCKMNVVHVLW